MGSKSTERDTTVVGPKGRKIERDIRTTRGPGYIDRQVEIKRPGETILRDTRLSTQGGRPGFGGPPPFFGGPRYYGGPRIVENVFVPRAPVLSTFIGIPGFSLFLGGQPGPAAAPAGRDRLPPAPARAAAGAGRKSTRWPSRSAGSRACTATTVATARSPAVTSATPGPSPP